MLIGRQLQQNKDKFKVTIPIILFFIVVGISLTMFNGGIDIYSSVYGKSTAVMYINAIVSSLALCAICQKITFHRIYVIELLSKGTLLILGVHIMCLSILKFLLNKIGVEYTFVLGLMCAFIVLLVCIPIIHIADCKFKWIIGK